MCTFKRTNNESRDKLFQYRDARRRKIAHKIFPKQSFMYSYSLL